MSSRVARKPVELPKGVEVKLNANKLHIKGPKGSLEHDIHASVKVTVETNQVLFTADESAANSDAYAGTTRAIVKNMVDGVTQGYEIKLQLIGVGYRAQLKGKILNLQLGFSHPVDFDIPEGITIEIPSQTEIIIKGVDKHLVGQVAANIRAYRPPEPYKGKGIRYATEVIKLKETKKK